MTRCQRHSIICHQPEFRGTLLLLQPPMINMTLISGAGSLNREQIKKLKLTQTGVEV